LTSSAILVLGLPSAQASTIRDRNANACDDECRRTQGSFTPRVDTTLLAEVAWPAASKPLAFICGPTNFVETVADALVGLGYPPGRVKTERFGGTGGP
jgi:ferredoxin-NADP reductase